MTPEIRSRSATHEHANSIELGSLVQKAGFVELIGNDRATLLGAMMELADQLKGGRDGVQDRTPQQLTAAWRHRGLCAFEANRQEDAAYQDLGDMLLAFLWSFPLFVAVTLAVTWLLDRLTDRKPENV